MYMTLNLVLRKDKTVFLFLSSRTLLLNVAEEMCTFYTDKHIHTHACPHRHTWLNTSTRAATRKYQWHTE